MDISIFKKNTGKQEQIDVSTAFNLWNLLRARYSSIETAQLMRNFVHDKDLEIVLDFLLAHFQDQAKILEKEAEHLGLKAPGRPAYDIITSSRIDEFTDVYIYRRMFSDMSFELQSLSGSVRTTLGNDRIRKAFRGFLLSHMADFEKLYKYGKLKGWEDVPPAYKTTKPGKKENLSVSDAWYLWHHISDRYTQSHMTQFFMGFVHDLDFKLLMELGLNLLNKQLRIMEDIALKNEVLLPSRPPATLREPIDPETLEDRFMYELVYKGIDDSIDMHIRAVIDTLRNDDLREIFLDFFKNELDKQDKFLKYGKLKGWALVPPIYVAPT